MSETRSPLDWRIRAEVERLSRRIMTMRELNAVGASKKEVLSRCRRGTLRRLHDGVYLIGAGELTWQEQILAAVLAGGATAKACAFSALRLRDLGDFASGPIHIAIAHTTTARAEGVVARRSRRVVPSEVVQGVPTVCVEEALLGVAAKVSTKVLHKLLTSAWRRHMTTPRKVLLHLEHHGTGVRGSAKLREVATLYVEFERGPGSEAEADFLFELYTALDAYGIEKPKLQFVVSVRGGTERRVPDHTWPMRRKLVEMKGLAAHGDYVTQDEDVEREAELRAAGWEVEEVTPRAIRERPRQTIERIIRFLQTPNAYWQPGASGA